MSEQSNNRFSWLGGFRYHHRIRTLKVDLDIFSKHFVNGVDLFNRLSTVGSGFDVYDWVEE